MTAKKVHLGDWELTAVSDGYFRLDGGSMFGVIPKPLWEKKKPADDRNRIRLGLNSLVLKGPDAMVIVESGIGRKMTANEEDIYGLESEGTLIERLQNEGIMPEDVDFVIHTHLHLDHCGWATTGENEDLRPTFPNARYIVQIREWEAAMDPDPRSRASYDRRNFTLLEQKGLLAAVDGETQVVKGLKVVHTGGHTPGHQVVYLESGDSRCVFLGDLVPTQAHIKVHWHMGWDLFPLDLMRVKKRLLGEALHHHDLLFFTHEDESPFAYLEGDEKNQKIIPLN
jgi:glyoxylase-like metal-dependent hydrolase (beta-lactamase superfamily II)